MNIGKRKIEELDEVGEGKQRTIKELKLFKQREVPRKFLDVVTDEEIDVLNNVSSSCSDVELIQKSMKIRLKYRISMKLPEDMDDANYYFENGLRKVYPYTYLYQATSKKRWLGRKLIEVMKAEFRDIPEADLLKRFETKRIIVNGEAVTPEFKLNHNDFICNRNHRHELPVLAAPIRIIHSDKNLLVVEKPPSLPVHPCGRFRHNSLINILHKEYNFTGLKVVHRIDRLVSGVVLIAKNTGFANQLERQIKEHQFEKVYVCRVVGDFPDGDPENDGFITVDEPIEIVQSKVAISIVIPSGKPSKTLFKKLSYNGKTSAVLCKPLTGRMHQIRVHLQYLGHPIINDVLYNCDSFGPMKGAGGNFGKSLKQLVADITASHNISAWIMDEEGSTTLKSNNTVEDIDEKEKEITEAILNDYLDEEYISKTSEKYKFDSSKSTVDPECLDCSLKYYEPPKRRLFMYLHALRYSNKDGSYESRMPIWAKADWPH